MVWIFRLICCRYAAKTWEKGLQQCRSIIKKLLVKCRVCILVLCQITTVKTHKSSSQSSSIHWTIVNPISWSRKVVGHGPKFCQILVGPHVVKQAGQAWKHHNHLNPFSSVTLMQWLKQSYSLEEVKKTKFMGRNAEKRWGERYSSRRKSLLFFFMLSDC